MAKADECLFLLEVLIDKIIFIKSPCFSDNNFKTCVSFDFLSLNPIEICDDEREGCNRSIGGPYIKEFNSGKSCLFALKEPDIERAMQGFPIMVTTFKALPCDCLPTKIVMGTCTIEMMSQFGEARNKYLADPGAVSCQSLKDSFRMVAPDGSETGDIMLYMRISCFGNLIITEFQGGMGTLPPIKSNSKSCNPKKEYRNMDDPCYCGPAKSQGAFSIPCGVGGVSGGAVCPIEQVSPCMDTDDPCFCSGPRPKPAPGPVACRHTEDYCLHVPKATTDPCEEIGAIFNGNEVKIRVPKATRKYKRLSPSQEELLQRCTCEDNNSVCAPRCGDGGDDGGGCGGGGGGRGGGGGPLNQMVFQVPDDMCAAQDHRTPFNSELAYSRRDTAGLACDMTPQGAPSGVRAHKTRHSDRDVFVLQIGKQSDEPERLGNIEVELVTPRAPAPLQKQASHSCKQVQCIVEAPPKMGKKGKKDKSKKGKGKKSKK